MRLFVCDKCMNVENSNSVKPEKGTYVIDDSYPNLHFMGMQGFGHIPERKGVIEMLCSKCNTGTHHGDNTPRKATVGEMALACFSVSNMITPGDHISGSIIPDKNEPCGYKLSATGIYMLAHMEAYCKDNGLTELDVTKHPLYDKWEEEGIKFNLQKLVQYNPENIKRDIEIQSKGGIIPYLKSKISWRDNQSETEREKKLRIAYLKRTIKAAKRKFHNSDDFDTEEAMGIHRMEAELTELKV